LQEVLISPPSTRLACLVLDTEEMIECDESDVDRLTAVSIVHYLQLLHTWHVYIYSCILHVQITCLKFGFLQQVWKFVSFVSSHCFLCWKNIVT